MSSESCVKVALLQTSVRDRRTNSQLTAAAASDAAG